MNPRQLTTSEADGYAGSLWGLLVMHEIFAVLSVVTLVRTIIHYKRSRKLLDQQTIQTKPPKPTKNNNSNKKKKEDTPNNSTKDPKIPLLSSSGKYDSKHSSSIVEPTNHSSLLWKICFAMGCLTLFNTLRGFVFGFEAYYIGKEKVDIERDEHPVSKQQTIIVNNNSMILS